MKTDKINFTSNSSFANKKLSKAAHKNMLALLKKMHNGDTFSKSANEIKSSAICEITTPTMRLNTCKFPAMKPSTLSADDFVKTGQTTFHLKPYAVININNNDGKIIKVFDDLKQGWTNIKKELYKSISHALNNYETSSVQKHTYTMRTSI